MDSGDKCVRRAAVPHVCHRVVTKVQEHVRPVLMVTGESSVTECVLQIVSWTSATRILVDVSGAYKALGVNSVTKPAVLDVINVTNMGSVSLVHQDIGVTTVAMFATRTVHITDVM